MTAFRTMTERGKLAGTPRPLGAYAGGGMDKQPAKNPAQKPVQPCNCHPSQKKMNCGTRRLDNQRPVSASRLLSDGPIVD